MSNASTTPLTNEQAAKLLATYVDQYSAQLCDGRRTFTLNTSTLRYINARIREWKRNLENEKNQPSKAGFGSWLWSALSPTSNNSDSNLASDNQLAPLDCEVLEEFFNIVPTVRIQSNRQAAEIDLSMFYKLSTLELSNCSIVFAKGCHQVTTLHCIESQVANLNMFYKTNNSDMLMQEESEEDREALANSEYVDPVENQMDQHHISRSTSDVVKGQLKHLIISFVEDFDSQPFIFERWNREHLRMNNLMLEYLESLTIQKLSPTPQWFNIANRTSMQLPPIVKSPINVLYPSIWKNLTKLICIDCGFTFIVENPVMSANSEVVYKHGLQYAPNLKEVVFSSNQISSILEDPFNSVGHFDTDGLALSVQTLDLSHNLLQSKIGSFHYFDRLFINIRSLNLSNNKLTQIMDICHLSMLESINLSHNNLSDWSDVESLQQLSELQELWLEGNLGLQANSNYREYACGFFSHLTKLMFDGKLATKWELNYHENAYGQKRKSGELSRLAASLSSSSDDESILLNTPGTFAIVSREDGTALAHTDFNTNPQRKPSTIKKEKRKDKKKDKKKKKRTVESMPIVLSKTVNNEIPQLSSESATLEKTNVPFEPNDKDQNRIRPAIQQRLEMLKKDGGDQWLLILNEFMADASKKVTLEPTPSNPVMINNSQPKEELANSSLSKSRERAISSSLSHSPPVRKVEREYEEKRTERLVKKQAEDEALEKLINDYAEDSEDDVNTVDSTKSLSNSFKNERYGSLSERRGSLKVKTEPSSSPVSSSSPHDTIINSGETIEEEKNQQVTNEDHREITDNNETNELKIVPTSTPLDFQTEEASYIEETQFTIDDILNEASDSDTDSDDFESYDSCDENVEVIDDDILAQNNSIGQKEKSKEINHDRVFEPVIFPVPFNHTNKLSNVYGTDEYSSFFINDTMSVFRCDDADSIIKARGTHFFRLTNYITTSKYRNWSWLVLDERSVAKDYWRTLHCIEIGTEREDTVLFPEILVSEEGDASFAHPERFMDVITDPLFVENIVYRVTCTEVTNLALIATSFPTIVMDYVHKNRTQLSLEHITDNLNAIFKQQFELKKNITESVATLSSESVSDIISKNEVFFKTTVEKQEKSQLKKAKMEYASEILKNLPSSIKPLYRTVISEMQTKTINLFDLDARMRVGLNPLPILQDHWALQCSLNIFHGDPNVDNEEVFLHALYSNYILKESDLDYATSSYIDNKKLQASKKALIGSPGEEISAVIILSNMHLYILLDTNIKEHPQQGQFIVLGKFNVLLLQQLHTGYNNQLLQLDFSDPDSGRSMSYLLLTRCPDATNQLIKYIMHSCTVCFRVFKQRSYEFFKRLRIHNYDVEYVELLTSFLKKNVRVVDGSQGLKQHSDPLQLRACFQGHISAHDDIERSSLPYCASLKSISPYVYPASAYGCGKLFAPITLCITSEFLVLFEENFAVWPMALLNQKSNHFLMKREVAKLSNIQRIDKYSQNVICILFEVKDNMKIVDGNRRWVFNFSDKDTCDVCVRTICDTWKQLFHIDLEVVTTTRGARSVESAKIQTGTSVDSNKGGLFNLFKGKKKATANENPTMSTSPEVPNSTKVNLDDEETIRRIQARRRARRGSGYNA